MRRAYLSHEHRLIVYWSPKCGCTTVASWFARDLLGIEGDPGADPRPALDRAGHTLRDKDLFAVPAGYHSVAFTREPLSRAISAFVEKFVFSNGTPLVHGDQLRREATALYRALRGETPDRADYEGITFLEFLSYAERHIRGRGKREPQLNHHWNTQVSFRWRERGGTVDQAFDLRDLDSGLTELSRRFGVPFSPYRRNATRYGADTGSGTAAVPSRSLAESGSVPAPAQFVTEETVRLAAAAYAIDYETFGYAVPASDAKTYRTAAP